MKVMVTKEVAEAIKFLRDIYGDSKDDGQLIATHAEMYLSEGDWWIDNARPLNDVDVATFARAILNGYEVDKPPLEKVREYYEGLKRAEDSSEERGQSGSQFRQGWQSVAETLSLLGIKIEGVND